MATNEGSFGREFRRQFGGQIWYIFHSAVFNDGTYLTGWDRGPRYFVCQIIDSMKGDEFDWQHERQKKY